MDEVSVIDHTTFWEPRTILLVSARKGRRGYY